MSQSSLAIYIIIQFLFFLLAFSRLSRAFLDQRRIELTHSDEHHYFHGIAWINAGIIIGVIEPIAGFARTSFGVALTRRILRLSARVILMYGLLKGCAVLAMRLAVTNLTFLSHSLDVAENFETLADELRGVSRINKRLSHMLGVNPQRMNMFRRISQIYPEQAKADGRSPAEKQREQRVTIHYEKGQAPFLQIRFSAFDLPAQAILADAAQQRRRSLSGLIPGAGSRAQQHGDNVSDEMAAARNAMLGVPRAESALVATSSDYCVPPDWIRPPERSYARQSGGAVSDNQSIVRELERMFPNLPPRVTGKYRGSILGQNYEEDPFPVVGVTRQTSLRQAGNAYDPSEEGGTSVALSSSGSIKRKPAPPLLDDIAYVSDRHKRPVSTWGGLTQNSVNHPVNSVTIPNSPSESTTAYSPDSPPAKEPCTPRPRRVTARDMIKRASRALSDASIRSAEWLASTSSPKSDRPPLTATDIEMYRRGGLGPRSARTKSGVGAASLSGENLLVKARRSTDDARARSRPTQPHTTTRMSIGEIPTQATPTLTHAELEPGCEHISLLREPAGLDGAQWRQRAAAIPEQQKIGPDQSFYLSD